MICIPGYDPLDGFDTDFDPTFDPDFDPYFDPFEPEGSDDYLPSLPWWLLDYNSDFGDTLFGSGTLPWTLF